jgi:formylglycine-generating enzyme required for sulfatase activity
VKVSWEDAKAFCQWLTRKEQGEGKIKGGQSYRLPTDAEWSVAVGLNEDSSGSPKDKSAKIKNVYPWGTEWPPPSGAGNYWDQAAESSFPLESSSVYKERYYDGQPVTSPVGRFNANRFGLYDMGGNVWQWCEDLYDNNSAYHVQRGASWGTSLAGGAGLLFSSPLLSSYRSHGKPNYRANDTGFRVVLVVGFSP